MGSILNRFMPVSNLLHSDLASRHVLQLHMNTGVFSFLPVYLNLHRSDY